MVSPYLDLSTLDIEKELKRYFGYDSFREGQKEVIRSVLAGNDTMAVMPTGSGKSICYQLPALIFSGITLVVSPLISLMRDQVAALGAAGIKAAYINSTLSSKQCSQVFSNASRGMYKIIYVAPERLNTMSFLGFAQKVDISFIAIDEAHCVSQWGHDFRQSYLLIKDFVKQLSSRPVVCALTATATVQVKEDISKLLELQNPAVFTTGYDRPGLYFGITSPENKLSYILDFIRRRPGKAGIIYCATRKTTNILYTELVSNGVSAVKYHAGLTEVERSKAQDDFIYDRCRVIVATNAFGMGIDKSNVAFVIHYNMPASLEAYYQEAGRAGRDGSDAECVLLYSYGDVRLARYLIDMPSHSDGEETNHEEALKIREINRKKLDRMVSFCKASSCLRANILSYFGENYGKDNCAKCSYCLRKNTAVTIDSTELIVGNLVLKTGGRYGKNAVIDLLAGRMTEKLAGRGYDRLFEFGALRLNDKKSIRRIIDDMIEHGLLYTTDGDYPLLKVSEKFICESADKKPEVGVLHVPKTVKADIILINELKKWRKELAQKLGVPPYVILTDMTLNIIAIEKPADDRELLRIKGISEKKAEKYGRSIISIVKKYK